jgi:hypothetical protein
MPLSHEHYLAVLDTLDEELFPLGLDNLRKSASASTSFADDGFWPPELAGDVAGCTARELLELHWALERHYADRIRAHTGAPEKQDFFLFIAYARVVGLRMAYARDMGFTSEELAFVLGAVEAAPKARHGSPRIIEVCLRPRSARPGPRSTRTGSARTSSARRWTPCWTKAGPASSTR